MDAVYGYTSEDKKVTEIRQKGEQAMKVKSKVKAGGWSFREF